MSGTLNKVMLIGHLGDEVKIHRFEDGGCVGRFPLATNETYMNKQTNERVSNTEWHNICLLYTSPSPRDVEESRMPSSA